jgi:hypothetical protein
MAQSFDPKNTSSDYNHMHPFWVMVRAILQGAPAMRAAKGSYASAAGPQAPVASLALLNRTGRAGPTSPYLPKFLNEGDLDYQTRRENAPFTNIYADISRNLAAKPFSKTLELDDETADDLKELATNIDGQGNNLHVFAREMFKAGLDDGITWVLVDYLKMAPGTTLADERGMGAQPYWVHITADRLLAVYSDFVNGKEIITHARIFEPTNQRDGYGEVCLERVRVFDRALILDEQTGATINYGPATWELHELQSSKDDKGNESQSWRIIGNGPITIGVIPLVPFYTGRREGTTWKIDPPLKDLAYLQVEEFQQESNLKTIKELAAFPMLAGNGVTPPTGSDGQAMVVPVGPRAVLFAPQGADGSHGEWNFIEPGGSSLTFLQADLDKLRTEMRDLGMQPLATANLTVITTANVSMKAHSAVQSWALGLKDALETAWLVTCQWLNSSDEPVVNVHTDFGVDFEAGTELDALLKCQAQGILSKQTVQGEFKRRGVLSDDFDAEQEEELLAQEDQGLTPEVAIDPATGEMVYPTARPKIITPGAPAKPATVN